MWKKIPGLSNTLDNEGEMEQMLFKTDPSEVNYTIVRGPTLTWEDITEKEILYEENDSVNVPAGSELLSREDVARFILSTLSSSKWDRKAVATAVSLSEEEIQASNSKLKEHYARYFSGSVNTH